MSSIPPSDHEAQPEGSGAAPEPSAASVPPASEPAAPAAAPTTPPARPERPAALRGIGRPHLIAALSTIGIGYAAMVVTAAIFLGLAALGASFSSASSDGYGTGAAGPMAAFRDLLDLSETQMPTGFRMALTLPFQLAAMALFGRLGVGLDARSSDEFYSGVPVTGSMPNVLILAAGIVAMILWARWWARRSATRAAAGTSSVSVEEPSRLGRLLVILASALAAAVVIQLITWASALRWTIAEDYYGSYSFAVSAASFQLMLGAFLIFALVLWLLSPDRLGSGRSLVERAAPGLRGVPRTMAVHLAVFCVPMALALIIVAFVKLGAAAGLGALLWLPFALAVAFGLGHLSGATASGRFAGLDSSGMGGSTVYLWGTSLPGWAVALVLILAVLSVLTAALVWAHQRGWQATPRSAASWLVLPVSYAVLGLALQLLLPARFSMDAPEMELVGSGWMGLAPWTFLVFLVVGAVIEVLARFVMPAFGSAVPLKALALIGGTAGAATLAAQPARAAAAPAAASASAPASPAATAAQGGDAPISATAQPSYDSASETSEEGVGTGTQSLPVTAAAASTSDPQAASTQPMGPPPRTPEQKKRARLILLILGGALLLVIALIVAHQILMRTVFSPAHEVEDMLGSVRDGRASEVVEVMNPNVPTEERLLLDDEIYAVSGTPVEDFEVTDVQRTGGTAMVTADVTQNAVTTSRTFELDRSGRQALIFPQWEFAEDSEDLYGTVTLEVPETDTLTINGVEREIPESIRGETREFAALPGDYSFIPAADSKYVTYGDEIKAEVRVDGSGGQDSPISFEPQYTDALEEDVTTAVNAKLDECATSTEFDPEGCPFSYSTFDDEEDYRGASWSIDDYPSYSVSADYDSEDGLRFDTVDRGEATVDYEHNTEYDDDEPADWESEDSQSGFSVSGSVSIDGDSVSVELDD